MQAFSVVREDRRDLLAFLGSRQIDANIFGIEFQGWQVMRYEEAFSLVANIPRGIRRLRQGVAVDRERFDAALIEWQAGGPR